MVVGDAAWACLLFTVELLKQEKMVICVYLIHHEFILM